LGAFALVASASAQTSLWNRYNTTLKFGMLPADLPWDDVTTWVTPDQKGLVYVLVRKAPYVRVFKSDGTFVKTIGDANMFTKKDAHSIHFDSDGNMWGVDTGDHTVRKFDMDGKVLQTLGTPNVMGDNADHNAFNRPATAYIAKNGDVFVADGYVNSRVVQYDKAGKFIRIFGGVKGSAPGQLQMVHGVSVDSKGRVFASDSDNHRISIFDAQGNYLENWPIPNRGGTAIGPDDTLYVSDVEAGGVTVMSKEGKIIDFIHLEGRPHGLGVDFSNGDVYTSSSDGKNPNVSKASLKPNCTLAMPVCPVAPRAAKKGGTN
jgi:DNA-binding beta-propeller fold protein YncE